MDLVELRDLVNWVDEHVRTAGIAQKYQTLRGILDQNTQGGQQQPSEAQKNDLLDAVAKVPIDMLSMQQQDMLERLNIGPFVGRRAVEMIQDVLYRTGLDLATAAERMGAASDAVDQGLARIDQIREGLEGLVDVVADRPETGVLIRVTFDRDAAIGNVVDLRDWSETWWEIARGIAMLHELPPEDVIVIGAGRGSLILDLSVNSLVIATTLTSILLKGLTVAERVIDLKIKAEGLRGMRLRNTRIAKELETEAETEKNAAAEQIVSEVAQEANLASDRGDALTALKRSVDLLLGFLERGGEVDCILPPAEEEAEDAEEEADTASTRETLAQLRAQVQEIRGMEARVRALEAANAPPD